MVLKSSGGKSKYVVCDYCGSRVDIAKILSHLLDPKPKWTECALKGAGRDLEQIRRRELEDR